MPIAEIGPARIRFDVEGDGYPILLIAPGGMRSANDLWTQMPWNPRQALLDRYRLIGMDQRNAGGSTGPVGPDDGWTTYIGDQLALLDHLNVERCHVIGMCIGGPYVLGLLRAAPERFSAAVLLQPVGIEDNQHLLFEMFDTWAGNIADDHPEADAAAWVSFRNNMWTTDRFLTASPAEIAALRTPMLVCMGNDQYHPQSVSRELASMVPGAVLVEQWKQDDFLAETDTTIKTFLAAHTP